MADGTESGKASQGEISGEQVEPSQVTGKPGRGSTGREELIRRAREVMAGPQAEQSSSSEPHEVAASGIDRLFNYFPDVSKGDVLNVLMEDAFRRRYEGRLNQGSADLATKKQESDPSEEDIKDLEMDVFLAAAGLQNTNDSITRQSLLNPDFARVSKSPEVNNLGREIRDSIKKDGFTGGAGSLGETTGDTLEDAVKRKAREQE